MGKKNDGEQYGTDGIMRWEWDGRNMEDRDSYSLLNLMSYTHTYVFKDL